MSVPLKFKTKVLGITYPGGKLGISGNNLFVTGLVKKSI